MPDYDYDKNDKYSEVIEGEFDGDLPDTEEEYLEESEHHEAADAYIETISQGPTPEDLGMDPDELEPLSWDDISVSSDPDLVSKLATYFDGMDPDEPTDRLQAKLRLLDCEEYANAQIAASAELRRE